MNQDGEQRARKAGEFLDQARAALGEGQAARALQLVQRALAHAPREAACQRLLAEVYGQLGKPLLAQRALAAAGPAPAPEPAPAGGAAAEAPPPPLPARRPLPPLSPRQQRHLLEQAQHALVRLMALERSLQGAEATPEAVAVARAAREALGEGVGDAARAWRTAPQQAATGPLGQPWPDPAMLPPGYREIPAFTHTLGAPGAVNKGAEVEQLQRLLELEGLAVSGTGRFDGPTQAAVRKLQAKYGLSKHDGIVNAETRRLLNHLVGKGS